MCLKIFMKVKFYMNNRILLFLFMIALGLWMILVIMILSLLTNLSVILFIRFHVVLIFMSISY